MGIRLLETKQKLVGAFISLIIIISTIYYNLNYVEQTHETSEMSADQYVAELSSVKHQLELLTAYSERVDKLRTETKKENNLDKARFNKLIKSCYSMKDDILYYKDLSKALKNECKNIKVQYYKLGEEIEEKKQDY